MRLHIIGVPSAGKTTLAKAVSDGLGVAYHGLDGVAFRDERWKLREEVDREALLQAILREKSFVSEGGFLGWTEPLFSAADHIIWLDPPLPVLISRHLRRFAEHPARLPSLLWFQTRMYLNSEGKGPAKDDPNQTRQGIRRALRPWTGKVYRVTGSVTGAELVRRLSLSRE